MSFDPIAAFLIIVVVALLVSLSVVTLYTDWVKPKIVPRALCFQLDRNFDPCSYISLPETVPIDSRPMVYLNGSLHFACYESDHTDNSSYHIPVEVYTDRIRFTFQVERLDSILLVWYEAQ